MKRLATFGKLMLKILIGGLLGFTIITVGLILKGYGMAGEMARDVLLVASENGCINSSDLTVMMEGFKDTYEVNTTNRDLADDSADKVRDKYFVFEWDEGSSPVKYKDYIEVTSPSSHGSLNLLNSEGNDFVSHVQRGSTITVKATVHVRLYLPFKLRNSADTNGDGISNSDWRDLLDGEITIPVSKTASGVSTKFFKGEVS